MWAYSCFCCEFAGTPRYALTSLTDLAYMVIHTLRHTFASWLVQRGTPLYTVSKLMGHSSIKMTERYAHLAPDTQRAAAMDLEGILK